MSLWHMLGVFGPQRKSSSSLNWRVQVGILLGEMTTTREEPLNHTRESPTVGVPLKGIPTAEVLLKETPMPGTPMQGNPMHEILTGHHIREQLTPLLVGMPLQAMGPLPGITTAGLRSHLLCTRIPTEQLMERLHSVLLGKLLQKSQHVVQGQITAVIHMQCYKGIPVTIDDTADLCSLNLQIDSWQEGKLLNYDLKH